VFDHASIFNNQYKRGDIVALQYIFSAHMEREKSGLWLEIGLPYSRTTCW
jgi:hypothetical protein